MIKIGQHWRDDTDGYLYRVVGFSKRGWPFVRHVNAKSGGGEANPAWFKLWTLTKDVIA